MSENSYATIKLLLASTAPEELRAGLDLAKKEIARVGTSEARPLFEMVSAIFYVDPFDHPELAPILDEAVSLIVGFGEWVIPMLIESLDAGDLKAQWAVANALGRIGADAIKPLMLEYASTTDLTRRAFILYTLGKVKSPKIAASRVARARSRAIARPRTARYRDARSASSSSPFHRKICRMKCVSNSANACITISPIRARVFARKRFEVWANWRSTDT